MWHILSLKVAKFLPRLQYFVMFICECLQHNAITDAAALIFADSLSMVLSETLNIGFRTVLCFIRTVGWKVTEVLHGATMAQLTPMVVWRFLSVILSSLCGSSCRTCCVCRLTARLKTSVNAVLASYWTWRYEFYTLLLKFWICSDWFQTVNATRFSTNSLVFDVLR